MPGVSRSVRVASFNIRTSRGLDGVQSWVFRRRRCIRALGSLDADVLLIQELRSGQMRFVERALPGYTFVSAGRVDGRARGERLAIGLRGGPPISPNDVEVRWFSESPSTPSVFEGSRRHRIALSVSAWGARWVCIHLEEAPNPNLSRCIELLVEWFGSRAIIGGDFNCRIDDPALAPLRSAGYRDALAHLAPSGTDCATHHGFTGSTDGSRIDHLFVPRDLSSSGGRIDHDRHGRPASDHWPVSVTVAIPIAEG